MRSLDIIVCLKSVPDPKRSSAVTLDPRTLTLNKQGVPRVISPLDKNALEEALRLRGLRGGVVRVASMGSLGAEANLREALAIGADEAYLLSDPACAGADSLATAKALAGLIRYLGHFDLILCGDRSFYGSTGQVGPQLAVLLDIAHVGHVSELQLGEDDSLRLQSRIEEGYVVVSAALPLLAGVVKEINTPRGISLPGIVAARTKPLHTLSCEQVGISKDEVGLSGSGTQMIRVTTPSATRQGVMIGGPTADAVVSLVSELRRTAALPPTGNELGRSS